MATKIGRTGTSSTNATKFTWSAWVKRADIGGDGILFYNYLDGNNRAYLLFQSNDTMYYYDKDGGDLQAALTTTEIYRDSNAFYHICLIGDSTDSTTGDRIQLYVNGVRQTMTGTYPDVNDSLGMKVHTGTNYHVLGTNSDSTSNPFSGIMSHVHYVDGIDYPATTFGSTDSTTGEWKINTSPSITTSDYGNNGYFVLKDGNSVTDQSGNSHNFTVTAGTLTKTEDNPSNVFATGNPLIGIHSNGSVLVPHTYSNGNLTSTSSGQQWRIHQSTLGASSGKYYAEFKLISNSGTWYSYVGIYDLDGYAQKVSGYPYLSDMANTYGLKDGNGQIHTGGSGTSYGVSYGTGNIIGVAMDLDNNKLYFSKDGTWMNSANPSNGTGGYSITADKTYAFGIQQYAQNSIVWSANYGNGYIGTTEITTNTGTGYQDADGNGRFYYAVPTGFRCLSTKGLNQ